MAYKVVVDKPTEIKAFVNSVDITVTDISLHKTSSFVSSPRYRTSITSRVINTFLTFTKLSALVNYQKVSAVNVFLDPFSLNRYVTDQVTITEAISIFVTTGGSSVLNASALNSVALNA
jgi:hypothetical protein